MICLLVKYSLQTAV